MAGNINNTKTLVVWKIEVGKAKFNGYAPFLFFLQSIAINTGQGTNKTRFPMIDMTGRAQDKCTHGCLRLPLPILAHENIPGFTGKGYCAFPV